MAFKEDMKNFWRPKFRAGFFLLRRGYQFSAEKVGSQWVVWAFPEGQPENLIQVTIAKSFKQAKWETRQFIDTNPAVMVTGEGKVETYDAIKVFAPDGTIVADLFGLEQMTPERLKQWAAPNGPETSLRGIFIGGTLDSVLAW